jgi:predicted ATP-binding protein involved in virulence
MAGRFLSEDAVKLKDIIYKPENNAAYANNFNRTIDFASTLSWFNFEDANEARDMRDFKHAKNSTELTAVRTALSKALLDKYEKPRMMGNPPELIVNKKGTNQEYKLSQLSDGYRAMLTLTMDLARRMAQFYEANALNEETILHTPAVVFIDEVELHLHPAWQQTVLTTLMDIFPNTQFIVTTHSPQVLTSIPNRHIRVLRDGKAHTIDMQTEGAEASQLLEGVFGVDLRPQTAPIVEELEKYKKLVYANKWDEPEATALKSKLTRHFHGGDRILDDLQCYIDNQIWERGYEAGN